MVRMHRWITYLLTPVMAFGAAIFPPVTIGQVPVARAAQCSGEGGIEQHVQSLSERTYREMDTVYQIVRELDAGNETNKDAFLDKAVAIRGNLLTYQSKLAEYAQNRCGSEAVFNNRFSELQGRIDSFNSDFVRVYNANSSTRMDIVVKNTLSYADDPGTAECEALITAAGSEMSNVDASIQNASQLVDKFLSDNAELSAADNGLTQAVNAYQRGKEKVDAAKAKGCQDLSSLESKVAEQRQRIDQLQTKIREKENSYINQAWNGLLDTVIGATDCGCNTNDDETNALNFIGQQFNRAICMSVCTLSKALGVIACFIIDSFIDPVFGGGSSVKTCDTEAGGSGAPPPNSGTPVVPGPGIARAEQPVLVT